MVHAASQSTDVCQEEVMWVPLWMLNESSAFLQLSAHACSIHADSKEISRGDWVKETNTKERKPESVRIDFFFFPQKDF